MVSSARFSAINRAQQILSELAKKLPGLPVEYQEQLQPDIDSLSACLAEAAQPGDQEMAQSALKRTADDQAQAARKQAEEALEISKNETIYERNQFKAVMEALPVGAAVLDSKGGTILTNSAFAQLWGDPPQAQSISDYADFQAWWVDSGEPVKPEEWASARAVQKGETVVGQFMQIQRFDGTRIYVLNSSAPILDAHGQIVGSAVVIMDVSDRVKSERALALKNSQFQTLTDNLAVGVVLTDPQGNFIISNPFNQQLFGGAGVTGDASGPRGGYTLHRIDGTRYEADDLPLVKALKEGVRSRDVEMIIRQENGEERYIESNTSPLFAEDGSITGAVAALQDITARKQAENLQREMEVQRRLSEYREKERQEIAREIHDGPIQSLAGTLFHIQYAKEAITEGPVRHEVEKVGSSIQSVIRELREVYTILRPPSLIQFGLVKNILAHAESLREQHPEIAFNLNVCDDKNLLPEQVCLVLYRIYQEAINNILRHSQATIIWVDFRLEYPRAILEIRDNGLGFPVPEHLLEQTQQGHYGLADMKERAESLGGTLEISSQAGVGTTILVQVLLQAYQGHSLP